MNEPQSPPPFAAASLPATSLSARLLNIFAAPGDVFEEIKARQPAPADWLTPLLCSCLAGVLFVWVAFSQETILRPLREA